MGEIERESGMTAMQQMSDAVSAAMVASDLPLYREQAGEWFTHAGRYADIARLCLEAGTWPVRHTQPGS